MKKRRINGKQITAWIKGILPKQKKSMPVMYIGPNRRRNRILWGILIVSVLFGVYKNFTAVDTKTVHEKKVVKQEVIDTNDVETFVKNFAVDFYTWKNERTAIDKRSAAISNYITQELQTVNQDMIRADIPTSSQVDRVDIWETEREKNEYQVKFSVQQTITEGEKKKRCLSFYRVEVHKDQEGNLVVIKNPTVCGAVDKSDYEPEVKETAGTMSAGEIEEMTEFLGTFFKLYPTAAADEIVYYAKEGILEPIDREDYIFSEISNLICTKVEEQVQVRVTVKYLDQTTKAVQVSQFDLTLEKKDNWKIVG